MSSRKNNSTTKKTFDVYVGHVPRSIDENAIGSVFSKFGPISDVLCRMGNGAYGFAIVKFKDQKAAVKAMEQEIVDVFGHFMEVRSGHRSNQSIENGNVASNMIKTVTFAEPPCIPIPPPTDKHIQRFPDHSFSDNIYGTFCQNGDGNHHEIMCVNVENAVTFHGCPMNRWKDLESLSLKLNSICPNLVRVLRTPSTNKVYGALFTADKAWYRCVVIQNTVPSKRGMCIVSYIDYGNIAEVSCTDMVELPEPLKALRPFAVKCVFSNLMCSPKSLTGVTYLHHLVMKRMSLYALPSANNMEFHVVKCSCNGIDVIAELLSNGYAVHKTQGKEISPLPIRSDIGMKSKPQTNKSKKGSGGKQHKIANGHLANGGNNAFRSCSEVNNNSEKACDNAPGCRNSSPDDSQNNFMPKKIIRRGGGSVEMPILDETKSVNHLLKIDYTISNVKLVNKIRSLVPLHTDDDLINNAVQLLQTEINETETAEANKKVVEVRQKYYEALQEIKVCDNQEKLLDLKKNRDELRMNVIKVIEEFLERFDVSLLAKKKEIQEIITALGSNSNACMDIFLAESPKTVEALLDEYNTKKEIKKNFIQKARENTNKKHENFQALLGDMQKEFTLNMVDGNMDEAYSTGKRGSWALKFEESLTEYSIALEEERNTSTMIKDTNQESIIDCILKKLDVPKEKIDAECDLFETYKAMHNDLKNTSDLSSAFEELYALKNTIEEISSNSIVNGDVSKSNNVLIKLHNTLLQEDALLATLARASVFHFPEFVLEHPNLKLQDYQDCYLLKNSWDEKFFPLFSNCNRIEPSFVSKLADEFVIIKEFEINSESVKTLTLKALTWNEIKSSCLVKIKGLFKSKEENILYGVISPIWETLFDNPLDVPVNFRKATNLLQKILEGLCDLHSRGIVHGAIHPLAILHKDDEVLLDFNFDRKYLEDKLCLKGINFKAPSSEDMHSSADMYGFGCLVLWVLFPNLSFNLTEQGIPNINAFQSIIQEVLSIKDYASLSALMNVNQDVRPTSRRLLSNKFLKDLRIMSEAVP